MKNTIVVLHANRLKIIPKKYCVATILLGLFCICLLLKVLTPMYSILEDTQDVSVDVASIHYKVSSGRFRTTGLEITSNDEQILYLWYPYGKWPEYSHDVEADLLTGEVSSVKAIITNKQSLPDQILGRKRIVDLRSNASVYYSIDIERDRLRNDYIGVLLVFPIVTIVWIIITYILLLGYGVLDFKKSGKKQR